MENIPDMTQLLKLAQSPAGQQLLSMLRQSGGDVLEAAITQASSGNYQQAKDAISSLLEAPEAQALLKQLEGSQ